MAGMSLQLSTMDTTPKTTVTAPGGSNALQVLTHLTQQGRSGGSNSNPMTTGVPARAPVGTHVDVKRRAPLDLGTGQIGDVNA